MMMLFPILGLLLIGGLLVALVIGGGVFLHKQGGPVDWSDQGSQPTARQTLDTRLARGEISRQEHEASLRQIES